MNSGKLNHRIRFAQLTTTQGEFGDTISTEIPVACSEGSQPSVTWGSLEPIKQYNQLVLEGEANVLNGDKILIIRYRNSWQPTKSMIFEDLNTPGDIYTVHSILPYYPGTKSSFQNSQQTVYKDKNYIFILGKKRS